MVAPDGSPLTQKGARRSSELGLPPSHALPQTPRRATPPSPVPSAHARRAPELMRTLAEVCRPRKSVFDPQVRDTVYSLEDLDSIDPNVFFEENYATEGMRQLLTEALKRLEGKSASAAGAFLLSQSMGGGKTHNLIALGLLAKHPDIRAKATQGFYSPGPLGSVRVVAFSGRKSNTPFGIWGEVAETLNKRDSFKDFYSPLKPPGPEDWISLLRGDPLLILLDELPPYFEAARAVAVGATTLATITTTALANLLLAITSGKLPNVCLVLTDLRGQAYGAGSAALNDALADLEKETNRGGVVRIDPVRINTNELYHVLAIRLFESVGSPAEVEEIADAYANEIEQARLMDITTASAQQVRADIVAAYPFHPAIRDLYARFKENPAFQQTRALMRIMRLAVADLWNSDEAKTRCLIGAEDIDLHQADVLSEIRQINPSLEVAIAHDIAAEGASSVAEGIDGPDREDGQDAAKLIFLSSLSQAVNPTLGLTRSELAQYLIRPGRDLTGLREVIDQLQATAWYIHPTADGKLLFRNVENLVAKVESYTKGMQREQAEGELRDRLKGMFKPTVAAAYQQVLPMPQLDQIQLQPDSVTLVLFRPSPGVQGEVRTFWDHQQYQNRVCFLTGPGQTYETVLQRARELRAVHLIIGEMRAENRREDDPQFVNAVELRTKKEAAFYQASRETFQQLLYPSSQGLTPLEVDPKYVANEYRGEDQVVNALREAFKFREDIGPEGPFRRLIEDKLWPAESKEVAWSEIKRRAATDPSWVWHHPRALDALRDELIKRDVWRQNGSFVERGPFPAPSPTVSFQVLSRNEDTGETRLRIKPLHADAVSMSETGPPTAMSPRLDQFDLSTKAVRLWFRAFDPQDASRVGEPVEWTANITVKHRIYQDGEHRRFELRAIPAGAVRFTTDGSSPETSGAAYATPFTLEPGTKMVLALAEANGVRSNVARFDVPEAGKETAIDPLRPATWRRHLRFDDTGHSYAALQAALARNARLSGVKATVMREGRWIEFTSSEEVSFTASELLDQANRSKELVSDGNLDLAINVLTFDTGADLMALVADLKLQIGPGEVTQ